MLRGFRQVGTAADKKYKKPHISVRLLAPPSGDKNNLKTNQLHTLCYTILSSILYF
jgi:hypothetical protein